MTNGCGVSTALDSFSVNIAGWNVPSAIEAYGDFCGLRNCLRGHGPGAFPNREAALRDFFENLQSGTPPAQFLEYDGTFLTTDLSHARYTMVLGMKVPTKRKSYQDAFNKALDDLLAGAASASWAAELISFLKMMLN
jgi:hypothetical protein